MTAAREALLDLLAAPDGAPALVEPESGERTTYGELRETADRLARSLAAAGVGPGDAVAMSLPNGPEIVAAFLGVVAAGAAAAPLNQAYTGDEFHAYLDDLRPRAMLFLRGAESPARAACGALGVRQLELTGARTAELGLGGVGATGSAAPRDPEAVALLLHTSGTTSKPKGVPIRQRNLAASARAVAATYGLVRQRREPLRDAALPRPRPRGLDARDAGLGRMRDRAAPLLGERVLGRVRARTGRPGTRPCRRSTASCSRAPRTARPTTPATGCGSRARAPRRCRAR